VTAIATPPPPTQDKPPRWPAVVAALVFFVVAFVRAVGPPADYPRDFFIYRLGAQLAIRGENPYDIPKTRQHVADNFPIDDGEKLLLSSVHLTSGDFANWLVPAHGTLRKSFPLNCGYFMPPMSVVLYAPFAMLPWVPAMILWAIVNGLAAYIITRLPMLLLTPGGPTPSPFLATIVPFLLVLNPIAPIIVFPAGQTSIVFLAFVVAGLMAYQRGWLVLMAALWVVPFMKPHLALSLVPLMLFLGGWRPTLLLVLLVGVLNALGATIIGGAPHVLKEYIEFLPQTRDAVLYNRIELNSGLSSWNRLLYAYGGPLIELGLVTTLGGYLVWYGLLIGRWALDGERPSAAWAVAATAAGAALCCQVLVYELMFLLVAVPWLRDLFLGGHRIRGMLGVLLIAAHLLDRSDLEALGLANHHPLSVALFALLVLTGPTRLRTAPPSPASP
jgi:hypothetical protein